MSLKWSNTFFVVSIVTIFCTLLVTVPINIPDPEEEVVNISLKNPKCSIKTPESLAQENSDSFYKYLESLSELDNVDP